MIRWSGFLLCVVLTWNSQAANDRGLFWEVSSPTATVYLLGSIHFGVDDLYPLRSEITQAYASAERLAVEIDITRVSPVAYSRYINQHGTYSSGETLADHVSASTWQHLQRVLKRLEIPVAAIENFKPGLVVMQLSTVVYARKGLSPETGIDMYFLQRARREGKPVVELESMEQQLDMLIQLPQAEAMLIEALQDFERASELTKMLLTGWQRGDATALEALLISSPEQRTPTYHQVNEAVLYKRNRDMRDAVRQMLAEEAVSFVIVGAGHLIGERGIVELLQQDGYAVERR